MVFVTAVRAFPFQIVVDDNFAVKAAHMAVVALGVELCVLNVIVNKAHYIFQRFGIVAHVRNFHVADSAAAGNFLELAFKGKFAESVDIFAHVNVVGIGVVAFIGNVVNSTEAFFIYAGKTVAQAFGRSAVQCKADAGLLFPFIAFGAQVAHYAQRKFFAHGVGMAYALHQLGHFVHADITERNAAVTANKVFINGFALF